MKQQLESFPDLLGLSLNSCGLENLNNLPHIPNLSRIYLSNNKFKPSEIQKLLIYKKLEQVSIGNNQINSIEDLKPLTQIDSIVQLDLLGTEFSKQDKYRTLVFDHFPNLIALDNKDNEGKSCEIQSEDEDDEFYKEDEDDDEASYEDVDDESNKAPNGKGKQDEEDDDEDYSDSEGEDYEDQDDGAEEEDDEDDD